jgi:hypothetical protein
VTYRCEALSVEGFIQQLAVCYVGRGYYFYVTGQIPERKDPKAVDEKIIHRYGVGVTKWSKWRDAKKGISKLQYLRFERSFVILSTCGAHDFFEEEGDAVRDARRVPIKCFTYAVSFRSGHPHVRIERETYKGLMADFLERALERKDMLEARLYNLPYEPYRPLRQQLLTIRRAVNRKRKAAGFEPLSVSCIRFRRKIVRPFNDGGGEIEEAA